MARVTANRTAAGLALGAAALVVSLGACSDAAATGKTADVATYRVEKRDIRATVSEKGTLKCAKQILIKPEIPGQAKILWLEEEGKHVKEGDIVCRLDDTEKVKQITDLETKVVTLEGQVATAEADLSVQLSQNESDLREADLNLKLAQLELERWEKGEFVEETKKREVRLEAAQSELERATRKYEQMPALEKEGFVTKEQVEEERIKKVKAESELTLAKLDQETYLKFAAPKDRQQREADVKDSVAAHERAKAVAETKAAQKKTNVEKTKIELKNQRANLENEKKVLANMIVRSPGAGVIVYGDARNPWDDKKVDTGETVYAGKPFITLPDYSEMLAIVQIHEADIARVATGMKAFVVVESNVDSPVPGEVVKVANVASSQGRWGDGIKRFNIDVALRGDITSLKLKPGLTARVEIQCGEKKDVLAVPVQAVFAQRGKFYVFKRKGAETVKAEVAIEDGNSQFSVVKRGLAEGDEILLYNPEAAAEVTAGSSEAGKPAAAPNAAGAGKPAASPGGQGDAKKNGGKP